MLFVRVRFPAWRFLERGGERVGREYTLGAPVVGGDFFRHGYCNEIAYAYYSEHGCEEGEGR